MSRIVLMSDPKTAAIPVVDCGEPLLDIRTEEPFPLDARRRDDPGAYAHLHVSPPEIAPHSTGAAVGLTLVDADGRELDMGTPVNANPEESDGACYSAADGISGRARAHRRLLSDALIAAGLVNYPTEWWHWSYGDRYRALATGAGHALYGPRELDA
ncbi:M15 family metallopeptidase [Streptomyces populi]